MKSGSFNHEHQHIVNRIFWKDILPERVLHFDSTFFISIELIFICNKFIGYIVLVHINSISRLIDKGHLNKMSELDANA